MKSDVLMITVYELGEDVKNMSECLLIAKYTEPVWVRSMADWIRLYFYDHPPTDIDADMYERAYRQDKNIHIFLDTEDIEVLPSDDDESYIVVHYNIGDGPQEERLRMPKLHLKD
jgi:hypothetical protein